MKVSQRGDARMGLVNEIDKEWWCEGVGDEVGW
jgi:hypothetical protein